MSDITAELIKITSSKDMMLSPRILQWASEVRPVGTDVYDVVINVIDPWTYGTLSSNCFTFSHFPTGSNYAYIIAKTLKKAHPDFDITWGYDYIDNRITIKYEECEQEKDYPYQELFKEKPWETKEKNNMELIKIITNGPATIGWFRWGRDVKKFIVKRAEGEYDDPEKAILALYMKAISGGHTPFHSRMNRAMKMMYAAIDKEREIEEAKLAREEKKDPAFGEDVVEEFKTTFNATEVSQEIASGINSSLDRLTSYANRLKETVKKIELNSVYGASNAKVEKNGTPWTWDEVSFLNRHYNSKSTKAIAMALGRSEYSVRSKAKRLGIKKGGNTHDA